MKHLRDIVEAVNADSFKPQAKGEKDFADQPVNKIADRNGNGDDVFKATNVKTYTRNKMGAKPTNEDGNVHKDTPLETDVKVVATEGLVPFSEITKKEWEDSSEDKRCDKKNGFKDGTAKDKAADAKMVKAINKDEKKLKEEVLAAYITSKRLGKAVPKVEEVTKVELKKFIKKAPKDKEEKADAVKEGVSPDPHQREVGTDALVNNFKSVTPGEGGATKTVVDVPKKKVSVNEALAAIAHITVQEVEIAEAKKVEEKAAIVEESKTAPKKSLTDLTSGFMRGGF